MNDSEKIAILTAALTSIAAWEMPPSGHFLDEEKTKPISYGVVFGSNGERDRIRYVARAALEGVK